MSDENSITFCGPLPPEVESHYERLLLSSTPPPFSGEALRFLEAQWGSTGGMRILSGNPECDFIKITKKTQEIPMDTEELKKRKKEFQDSNEIYLVIQCNVYSTPPALSQCLLYGKEEVMSYKAVTEDRSFRIFDFFTREEIDLEKLEVEIKYKDS